MKKTILYIRTGIYDHELIAGGSVTHTIGVIQGFLSHGHTVLCASSCMIKALKSIKELKHLKELKNPKTFSFLRWKLNCFISSIFFTLQTLQLIKKKKVNFIYQRYSILNCTGIIISNIKKIPLILEYNGSEAWINRHWIKKTFLKLKWLINAIEILNLKKANFIVVVSEVLKNELMRRGIDSKKILVNPNGVDTEVYNPEKLIAERIQIRKNLNIENKFIFGFIGTFSQWHGIDILEKIIPEVIKQRPNAHFILIGNGPLCASLKESLYKVNCKDHVTFTGLLPSKQARNYLAACDAFLSPTQPNIDGSPFFGSPTKIFEYMSLAKPIIASDLGQLVNLIKPAIRINELNNNNKYSSAQGFLVQPKNKTNFVKVACKIIDLDKDSYTQIGKNIREKAIKEYSWHKHVLKIISFLS